MTTRIEHDSLGAVEVPADRLWGAQTQRSLEHFRISGERMPIELLRELALVKRAAAIVNQRLGVLDGHVAQAIARAADEAHQGLLDAEFPLVVWQTGSGTQSNMNMNEVLANRASELLGGPRGEARLVHPNDHVNKSQSSNDAFPTAMSMAALRAIDERVVPAVATLRDALSEKAHEFGKVVKLGRTHLMDATPVTLGQEIGGWAHQLTQSLAHLDSTRAHLRELALGGTAVGTGLNAPPHFAEAVASELTRISGLGLKTAPNKFEALAAHDAIVFAHGALKTLAAALFKLANDVRWLASGPRSGLFELSIPENEPGSSIMPGKVNPTQAEAMLMACAQVFGNDVALNIGGSNGNFELNVFKPLIINAFLQSARLLTDCCLGFRQHLVLGMRPNEKRIAELLERSLMLVTALTPHIGYENAARIARKAHLDGTTLKEAALTLGLVSADDFERWVRPEQMLGPR
ncbi:MAG TPA: class II fumarate hydratase [Polyangiaceae bacterium]|nr:class II fumarate hydratase [Polyangiaceae bacterium]